MVFAVLVFISAAWFWHQQAPLSENIIAKKARYRALVVRSSFEQKGFTRIDVDLKERLFPMKEVVSGRIRLTVGEACPVYAGSVITFLAAVTAPTSYQNPGVFDYARYLRRQNIWGKAFVPRCGQVAIEKAAPPGWRDRLQERIKAGLARVPTKNGPTLQALLLGTRTLDAKTQALVRRAGIAHLFAISGTHFGMMSLIIYLFISVLTAIVPSLYLKVPRQKMAAGVTLVFTLFYMFLVAHQPSVLRAGTMIALYLSAILLNRQRSILYVILFSASVILFFKPMEIFSVSFQLSYLSVLILAIVYRPLKAFFLKHPRLARLPKPVFYLLQLVALSWILNLLLSPLLLLVFGEVPLSGFFNNLWAVPYFQFVVIPFGLVSLLSALTFPTWVVIALWDSSIGLFYSVLTGLDAWPWPALKGFSPHGLPVLLFYLTVLLGFLVRKRFVFVGGFVLVAVLLCGIYYQNHLSYDLRITQLDVGQGDATLVQTRKKNILIDTGGHRFFDVGERVVLPYLRHIWVRRLDLVVITHSDYDHYGALSALLENVNIGAVWVSDFREGGPAYERLLEDITDRGIPLRTVATPIREVLGPDTILEVLAPTSDFNRFDSDNDHSIVLKISHRDFSALFTGDISWKAEAILTSLYGDRLRADLLKVAHHGSRTSTTEPFLDLARPWLATIGVAKHSRFGHPHASVLGRLRGRGIKVLRTDLDGAVGVVVRDGHVRPWRYRQRGN